MPKITEAKRESRRQLILDAALRCFARDGFHNTTTADIVRESGVSQGSLYLYFATKDDIIVALADDRHQGEAMVNALVQTEQNPIDALSLLMELHGRSLIDPQRIDRRKVGIQGWAEALRNPVIRASVVGGADTVRREIVALIERGQASGHFRKDVSPDAFARVLIAIFQGMALQTAWGETPDFEAMGRLVRDMVGGSLLTERSPVLAKLSTDPEFT